MKKNSDRNFDSIADKFQRNIYQTSKGQLRQQVLLRDLLELPEMQQPQQLLDVGAGQGQLALTLASHGHQLLLTDISGEMLAVAEKNAQELGVAAQIQCQQSSLQQLSEHSQTYAVVLCHAMLEWLAEPQQAISCLKQLVAPGGILSLMFYNLDAKRFGNLIYGNFDYVVAGLKQRKTVSLSPQHPLVPADVLAWCEAAGFQLLSKTGVRCFHDYLRQPAMQQSHYQQLLELELAYNRQEPYASLGKYIHLLLRAV
ncbi:methyltransferase domain-containing protein [Alkalimonas mucilaginosa]|uniref:tRNA 5-carboxymethoxyuridine methyltransferase n=1 Tax=Alkalimonas mucilaginosa TaxID=3057676 RepID=A0ABU7JJZ6_9GAMM|nr:methyltransferase domain-containing protein [Alkalimonas sp. MEB004]MEE2025996.1 methyltransferase domain-containing protein [Alkalimonas sp. MEB004]